MHQLDLNVGAFHAAVLLGHSVQACSFMNWQVMSGQASLHREYVLYVIRCVFIVLFIHACVCVCELSMCV